MAYPVPLLAVKGIGAVSSSCWAFSLQPDGHCMYRAVQDQLSLHSSGEEAHSPQHVFTLRHKTADYIRHHKADFLPFLTQVCYIAAHQLQI